MKIKNLTGLLVLAFFVSFPVDAQRNNNRNGNWNGSGNNDRNWRGDNDKNWDRNGDKYEHNHHHGSNNTVGAPLDGGLLTVLGAAGVAYYVSRKKRKNGEVL